VKKFRLASKAASTRKFADSPSLFCQIAQPETDYILVPSVSSENRKYIPIGFMKQNVITSNLCFVIPNGDLFLFGNLTSLMHMSWVKYVCGRLKSDYRYSKDIVYNNYPFPQNVSNSNKEKVEKAAQNVLDCRVSYSGNTLADLYGSISMPPDLIKAHNVLDRAVDLCYRPQAFTSELNRMEFLFGLYEQLSAPIFKINKKKS
jgi:hypothetical protein